MYPNQNPTNMYPNTYPNQNPTSPACCGHGDFIEQLRLGFQLLLENRTVLS